MRKFSIQVFLCLILLAGLICPIPFLIVSKDYLLSTVLLFFGVLTIVSLYRLVTSVNQKLTLFFESIQYSDFTVKFSSDNKLGRSFKDLNLQMNQVIDAFKAARAEKEANIHYLNTLVQHVDVGILCYDSSEHIELLNNAAIRLLGVYRLRNLSDLLETDQHLLYHKIKELPSKGRLMYETKNGMQLAINSTKVNLRGRAVKIVSLQNIKTELQEKEVSSWQNLTKVLRHEIMNSIAPIVSLVGTMRSIVNEDLGNNPAIKEPVEDLDLALETIETRGKGIMKFVNAYRDFTTLPKPVFTKIRVSEIITHLASLNQNPQISIKCDVDFEVNCDRDQIEMILINLLKNAKEAIEAKSDGFVNINTKISNSIGIIEVHDNGSGIVPEALEKIFIPFYTTKKTGSGIGLSLSKQIMQMHNGELAVKSELGKGTVFGLIFNE